jgi:hypothetical protein
LEWGIEKMDNKLRIYSNDRLFNKKKITIDNEDYYFDVQFTGDAATPIYKVTMYQRFDEPERVISKFLWFKRIQPAHILFKPLKSRTFHESTITTFPDICVNTYKDWDKMKKKHSYFADTNEHSATT